MIKRNITPLLEEALADTPVLYLRGARQVGKSTLARQLLAQGRTGHYHTLDDPTVLSAVRDDPEGFLQAQRGAQEAGLLVLDEVQRAPALFLALKRLVDEDRRPGQYLLTGSAHVLLLPRIADALVGRMEVFTLWPFSQGERHGRVEQFVDAVFAEVLPPLAAVPPADLALWDLVVQGGFPEVQTRPQLRRKKAWYRAYLATLLERDVRDLSNIEGLTTLPRLMALLASRSAALVNHAELSRSIGVPPTTLKRYLSLLKLLFLIHELPVWSTNLSSRIVKAPKLLMGDTGLAAHLAGMETGAALAQAPLWGNLLENFVALELLKQATWSAGQPSLYHFRLHTGQEVDLVLEDAHGRVVGIEVKAATQVSSRDLGGLKTLSEHAGVRFHRGIVLYRGSEVVGFGPHLHAVPLPALWNW
jgi:predicted AAA+ superfamily ATPase